MLLDAGSSINYKDCGECTPLFHAIYSHQTEVADILIKGIYLKTGLDYIKGISIQWSLARLHEVHRAIVVTSVVRVYVYVRVHVRVRVTLSVKVFKIVIS